jgi:large subunit ribosomal protein L6
MSRVGKLPIKVQKGVKVEIKDGRIRVEGPKGKLSRQIPKGIAAKVQGEQVLVTREGTAKEVPALHGLTRTLVHNMVEGVANGFTRELDIVGVGFRAQVAGNVLTLNVGFSHSIDYKLPEGIQAKVDKNTHIVLTGADKELLGVVAAKVRSFREPEPYQGKGIRHTDERIIKKQGKAAGAK